MYNDNLLASVALFSELYKNDDKGDLGNILSDFIIGAAYLKKKYSANLTELKKLLSDVYGFNDIPESVIKSILKNKLKKCSSLKNGYYHFDFQEYKLSPDIDTSEIVKKQEVIVSELCEYISNKKTGSLPTLSNEEAKNKLSHFLMDNYYWENDYRDLIGRFIISKDKDISFNECLNTIKEGLVLYQGLCYSEDISNSGNWKNELTIYLSMEYLFSFMGYNGILYNEIFEDFFRLVKEINLSEKSPVKKGIIHLKYFEETKNEIDSFFAAAEYIITGKERLDVTRPAMVSIVNGCNDVDDIKRKQAKFYAKLKESKIELQEYNYESIEQYNIFDESLINDLKEQLKDKKRDFNEDKCIKYLQMFSKINYYRKGINNIPFEKTKHIYITDDIFVKFLGSRNNVKFNEKDAPFAKDIDYVISRFWFKLRKGLGNDGLPKNFDMLNKAKLAMSHRITNVLSEKYEKLKQDMKDGKLTKEEAIELNIQYKKEQILPENVNSSNIEDIFALIEDTDYENFHREKTRREEIDREKTQTIEDLEAKLRDYQQKEKELKEKELSEKLNKDSNCYALKEWKKIKKDNISNFFYFLLVLLFTILPVGIGLLLTLIEPINCWFSQLNYIVQIITWIVLTLVFLVEILGRSYFFDKEKAKKGWSFLRLIFSFKYKSLKNERLEEFKEEFSKNERRCE